MRSSAPVVEVGDWAPLLLLPPLLVRSVAAAPLVSKLGFVLGLLVLSFILEASAAGGSDPAVIGSLGFPELVTSELVGESFT